VKRLLEFLETRSGLVTLWRQFADEPTPRRYAWLFTLGSAALIAFLVQLATGLLLSLYYAPTRPGLQIEGFDLNPRRIEMARAAARRLGLSNVRHEVGNVMDFRGGRQFAAAYMLDIVHHVPVDTVRPLLEQVAQCLPAGGRLVIKDVDSAPAWKRWFTFALDKLMDPKAPVRYWPAEELSALLESVGFRVYRHLMVDVLPYPHVLYTCERLP